MEIPHKISGEYRDLTPDDVRVCPECRKAQSGWPDSWANDPHDPYRLRYVCAACVEERRK